MVRYTFREDGPVMLRHRDRADPQKLGEALEAARQATPEGQDMRATAIEHARNRRNALHPHLEWDDALAAHQHRLTQINLLITSLRVEDVTSGEKKPAFISVKPANGRRHFATPVEIFSSLALQQAVMQAAERDLSQWRARYRMLGDICVEVQEMEERIRVRREAMEADNNAAA
jgi:hypothetical protein